MLNRRDLPLAFQKVKVKLGGGGVKLGVVGWGGGGGVGGEVIRRLCAE